MPQKVVRGNHVNGKVSCQGKSDGYNGRLKTWPKLEFCNFSDRDEEKRHRNCCRNQQPISKAEEFLPIPIERDAIAARIPKLMNCRREIGNRSPGGAMKCLNQTIRSRTGSIPANIGIAARHLFRGGLRLVILERIRITPLPNTSANRNNSPSFLVHAANPAATPASAIKLPERTFEASEK